jgi:hypothetical protein
MWSSTGWGGGRWLAKRLTALHMRTTTLADSFQYLQYVLWLDTPVRKCMAPFARSRRQVFVLCCMCICVCKCTYTYTHVACMHMYYTACVHALMHACESNHVLTQSGIGQPPPQVLSLFFPALHKAIKDSLGDAETRVVSDVVLLSKNAFVYCWLCACGLKCRVCACVLKCRHVCAGTRRYLVSSNIMCPNCWQSWNKTSLSTGLCTPRRKFLKIPGSSLLYGCHGNWNCHVFPGAYRHVVNEAQGHVAPDVRHPPSNVSEQQLLDAAARREIVI